LKYMGSIKKKISLEIIGIFTMYIILSGVQANAVANISTVNSDIKAFTYYVEKAENITADKAEEDRVAAAKATTDRVTVVTSMVTPQAISINPDSGKKKLNIHAFYSGKMKYDDNTKSYLMSLNTVSFAWLDLKYENCNVILDGKDESNGFYIPQDYDKPLSVCKDNGIPAQISIYADGNVAKAIMSDNALKETLINKIIENLSIKMPDSTTFDFSGVVIDFEGFRNTDTGEYFNKFLSELKTALAVLNPNLYLYVAINVRNYWHGYDYKGILKYADKVILMAHDYEPIRDLSKGDIMKYIHYDSKDPIFSLAPINNVRAALENLISCINSKEDMSKIWLQISFGIAQWQFNADSEDSWDSLDNSAIGKRANPTYDMLENRLSNQDKLAAKIDIEYIDELQSPYLLYYNLQSKTFNFILYEDERSVKAKINLAEEEGIDGISLWCLGNAPDINDSLGENYYMNVWSEIEEAKKQ
jgi:internalin A